MCCDDEPHVSPIGAEQITLAINHVSIKWHLLC
jgi:hypothetical protein